MPPPIRRARARLRRALRFALVIAFALASSVALARRRERSSTTTAGDANASPRDGRADGRVNASASTDAIARDESDAVMTDKDKGENQTFWARTTADHARANQVKDAMREAYGAYATHAFGADELAPNSRERRNDFGGIGATLIDSLDTLKLMGLEEEFARALTYLKDGNSKFRALVTGTTDRDVSVFETNIRVLGGLLSTYDMTGDGDVLELAETLATRLSAAFQTPSGVPRSFVNVKTGRSFGLAWTGTASILADFGSMHLEWATLSARSKNPIYEAHTAAVFDAIARAPVGAQAPKGLFPVLFDPERGAWVGNKVSFGALGDSFYEYLIKCWRSLDGLHNADAWRLMFDAAIAGMNTSLLRTWKTSENGETFSYITPIGDVVNSMEHLACFAPGILILGAAEAPTQALGEEYVRMAKDIARTCVAMYTSTATGLAADRVQFAANAAAPLILDPKNIQRPETVESLFYLYRKTGEEMYRDQAWMIFQSMKKHYRTAYGGWQGLVNVNAPTPQGDDKMQSFFLAETLKYLYLTFCDSSVVHLDEWVFNTEAHPLKITKQKRSEVIKR